MGASDRRPEIISSRAEWAVSIGTIAADVVAVAFFLPIPGHMRRLFEDTVRQEVASGLEAEPPLSIDERRQLQDIAWIAFDRRLSRHVVMAPCAGFS